MSGEVEEEMGAVEAVEEEEETRSGKTEKFIFQSLGSGKRLCGESLDFNPRRTHSLFWKMLVRQRAEGQRSQRLRGLEGSFGWQKVRIRGRKARG